MAHSVAQPDKPPGGVGLSEGVAEVMGGVNGPEGSRGLEGLTMPNKPSGQGSSHSRGGVFRSPPAAQVLGVKGPEGGGLARLT